MSILIEHHVIPQRFRNHPAFRGLDLEALGVDSRRNLIYLPADFGLAEEMNLSPHPGGRVPYFYKEVEKVLDQIAIHNDESIRSKEITDLTDAMRVGLINGDLFVNVPNGKTLEEVHQRIDRIVKGYTGYRAGELDRIQKMQEFERRATEAGHPELAKLGAILSDAKREKLLDEAIKANPEENVTAGNKDLGGTQWKYKTTVADDSFRVPASEPARPNDLPPLPGFAPPPLPQSNPEGFAQSDPRQTSRLPGFPDASPDWQRIGRLPPSTPAPQSGQVLGYETPNGRIDTMPKALSGPLQSSSSTTGSSVAPWLLGVATLGTAAVLFPEWFVVAIGLAAVAGAARGRGIKPSSANGTHSGSGNTFAQGSSAFTSSDLYNNGGRPGSFSEAPTGLPLLGSTGPEQSQINSFAYRFGNWTDTPAGTMPAQPLGPPGATGYPAAEATVPDEIRRLTRMNASNARNVFESGSAPVPYLPPLSSPDFNDRFGDWRAVAGERGPQASSPVRTFIGDPGHVIPPPIWGSDASVNLPDNMEEWFSRRVQPLLRQD